MRRRRAVTLVLAVRRGTEPVENRFHTALDIDEGGLDPGEPALDAGESLVHSGQLALDAGESLVHSGQLALDLREPAVDLREPAVDLRELALDVGLELPHLAVQVAD